MKTFHFILLCVLFVSAMGAGPCDVIDKGADGDEDNGVECNTLAVECKHSLDIDVLLAGSDEYPSGTYTFQIVAPDSSVYAIDCFLARADVEMECMAGNLTELFAYIDPSDYSLMHFHINGAPSSCTVSVFYNDQKLTEKHLAPDYELSYPNGEGCTPVCYAGESAVAVAIY